MAAKSQKITFTGATGEALAARLDLPEGRPKAYALWAHCFSCTKDVYAASRVSSGLTARGIAVFRFDFTGLGASEGDFANTNFSSNVGDLVAAADYMRRNLEAPKILIGHSLGGSAVLVAASKVPESVAVITIAAPADPAHVAQHFQKERAEIVAKGEAEVLLVGRPFRIKKQFLDDIENVKLQKAIAGMKRALLIFHSPIDNIVGIDNAARIFEAARHPKSFVSLDNADHLLARRADAIYVADVIAAWATRYLGALPADERTASAEKLAAAPGTVVVAETGKGKFANAISVGGRHALLADEPVEVGGNDTGPGPYDYLLAALGSCKAMTMRLYADRKGIPMSRARVTLSHDRIHAEDCADCETKDGDIDRIAVEIALEGDMDEAVRKRIAEIADKCPVHRTLTHEIKIDTRLKA